MIFMTTKIHSVKRLLELLIAFISFLTTKVKQENEGEIILPAFSLLMAKEIAALMQLITS